MSNNNCIINSLLIPGEFNSIRIINLIDDPNIPHHKARVMNNEFTNFFLSIFLQ